MGVMRPLLPSVSSELSKCFGNVKDSANAAQAHYQVWFALRGDGKALKKHFDDMNDYRYVEFFRVSNIGNYKMMFIEAACLFDSDPKTDSLRKLKALLKQSGFPELVTDCESALKPYARIVSNLKTVRSRIIAHKESAVDPKDLYRKHGIKPNHIRDLLNATVKVLQRVEHKLNSDESFSSIGPTDRWERATFGLLEVLQSARRS